MNIPDKTFEEQIKCGICGCSLLMDQRIENMAIEEQFDSQKLPTITPMRSQTLMCSKASKPIPMKQSQKLQTAESFSINPSLSPPEILILSPQESTIQSVGKTLSFSRRKNKHLMSTTNLRSTNAVLMSKPKDELVQWIEKMKKEIDDFCIPCERCYEKYMNQFVEIDKQFNESIYSYQLTTTDLFKHLQTIEDNIDSLEHEIQQMEDEIEMLEKTKELLNEQKEEIESTKEVIENHLKQCYQVENEIISLSYDTFESVQLSKTCIEELTLPVQKKLTWLHLFQKEQIVPELSSFAFINFVKSRPISPILGVCLNQLKILAHMINYQYTSVLIDPPPTMRKANIPIITSHDISLNNKKTNRIILQSLLDMLNELAYQITNISKNMFFLIYQIDGSKISNIDFTNYDHKKWSEALNAFLSNTEHCYKWINRELKDLFP